MGHATEGSRAGVSPPPGVASAHGRAEEASERVVRRWRERRREAARRASKIQGAHARGATCRFGPWLTAAGRATAPERARAGSELTTAGSLNHLRLSVRDPSVSEAFYDPLLSMLGYLQIPRHDGGRAWSDASGRSAQWLIFTPVVGALRRRAARSHRAGSAPPGPRRCRPPAGRSRPRAARRSSADVLDAPAEYDYDPGYYAVFFRDPDGFKLEVVRLAVGRARTEVAAPRAAAEARYGQGRVQGLAIRLRGVVKRYGRDHRCRRPRPRRPRGDVRRAARPQRRGQDDDDEDAHRAGDRRRGRARGPRPRAARRLEGGAREDAASSRSSTTST